MLKVSDVSPLSALGPGVQLMPRVVGGAREKGAGAGTGAPLGACRRAWSLWPLTHQDLFSPGPVCPVLVGYEITSLRPAAVPEAGGAAGAEESGPREGHGGAGCKA